jgi:hypothetical protein
MQEMIAQISTMQAIELAASVGITVTRPTIVAWCQQYELGHQLGSGKWSVFRDKYIEFLNGRKDTK